MYLYDFVGRSSKEIAVEDNVVFFSSPKNQN